MVIPGVVVSTMNLGASLRPVGRDEEPIGLCRCVDRLHPPGHDEASPAACRSKGVATGRVDDAVTERPRADAGPVA